MTAVAAESSKSSHKTRTIPYDVADQLRTPEEMAAYLDAWLTGRPMMLPGSHGPWEILRVPRECPKWRVRRASAVRVSTRP